jgi:hypothetical protein
VPGRWGPKGTHVSQYRLAGSLHEWWKVLEKDLPQSSQEENMLQVDAQSHTQGEALPCFWLKTSHTQEREEVGQV